MSTPSEKSMQQAREWIGPSEYTTQDGYEMTVEMLAELLDVVRNEAAKLPKDPKGCGVAYNSSAAGDNFSVKIAMANRIT